MRRFLLGACTVAALAAVAGAAPGCGSDDDNGGGGGGGNDAGCVGFNCADGSTDGGPKPGCVGLECQQVPCEGGAKTTVTGTVLDPAGKVPLYNVTVYVPNAELAPLTEGAACNRCDAAVSGKPIAITATDTSGKFTLENVPVGDNIPLVMQIGKWRRKVTIPTVGKCTDTALDAAVTRLPKNRTEGDIPRIAVATGGADPLQCLLRKIGLEDTEFGIAGSEARVHLFTGGGFTDNGTPKPASSQFAGGQAFTQATSLWGSVDELKKYDVVLLACDGSATDNIADKPPAARQALYDYAKAGGRVFASHYHHVWFSDSPDANVKAVATWADPEKVPPAVPSNPATTPVNADISTSFPKAAAMKEWLTSQNALSAGKLPIVDARHNVDAVASTALNWISLVNPNASNGPAVQYMTFNTPVGAADDAVCGRVVFSNLHVASGAQGGVSDDPQAAFPTSCKTADLSAQQKALEFMLFDLSSCVQKDDAAIVPPR